MNYTIVDGLFSFFYLLINKGFREIKCQSRVHFPKLISYPTNIIIALFGLVKGLLLILWSILHFIKVKGTPVPFNPPPKLVTTGPYSYIRNPMLSGVFIFMLGFGFLFSSISLTFIFTPLFPEFDSCKQFLSI